MRQIQPDEVLQHPRRQAIYAAIRQRPGICFNELHKATGIANGTLQHHLSMLSRHGFIIRKRVRSLLTHHPVGRVASTAEVIFGREPYLKHVLHVVARLAPAAQNDILDALGPPRSTGQHRLERLESLGLVRSTRHGRRRVFDVVA